MADSEQISTHSVTALSSWRRHFPDGDLWVFGYGSLIWKPPPHYDQRIPGYIKGYVRRFWQASADHRGTPESNGRVVTVIERSFWETLSDPANSLTLPPTKHQDVEPNSNESLVWGAAYHIPASHAEEVNAYLDHREINGYSVHYTSFHPHILQDSAKSDAPRPTNSSSSPFLCMVYIGLPANSQFLRSPADRDPSAVAQVIYRSRGQSGENKEYLYLLEKALEGIGLGHADAHVTDLVKRVRALEGVREGRKSMSEIMVERISLPEEEYREDEAMEEVDEPVAQTT